MPAQSSWVALSSELECDLTWPLGTPRALSNVPVGPGVCHLLPRRSHPACGFSRRLDTSVSVATYFKARVDGSRLLARRLRVAIFWPLTMLSFFRFTKV